MCYDIKVLHETALKRARRKNDMELMSIIEKELEAYNKAGFHHVSGFSFPKIPVYANDNPNFPTIQHWGLIPFWAKDEKTAQSIKMKTLNARAESLFEKPSFRNAIKNKRCLIFVDGFYEHHHFKGKTYPYFIQSVENKPLCLAGIWDEWINTESGEIYRGFSIVTTKANELMRIIHNNPKLQEARMPLQLILEDEERWLADDFDNDLLREIEYHKTSIAIKAHPVRRLRGKEALGNIAEAAEPFNFPELKDIA